MLCTRVSSVLYIAPQITDCYSHPYHITPQHERRPYLQVPVLCTVSDVVYLLSTGQVQVRVLLPGLWRALGHTPGDTQVLCSDSTVGLIL